MSKRTEAMFEYTSKSYGAAKFTVTPEPPSEETVKKKRAYNNKPTVYRGISMRSQLEAHVAGQLDKEEIRWFYEPTLPLKNNPNQKYCMPDFFLYDYKVIVEVRPSSKMDERLDEKLHSLASEYGETFVINEASDVRDLIKEVLKIRDAVNYGEKKT